MRYKDRIKFIYKLILELYSEQVKIQVVKNN